jgi:CRISPR-associated helicase Cas3/CRISPR-associated endonuclease Cas3-HD
MRNTLYAHTKFDVESGSSMPESDWQLLASHLDAVSDIAQKFAEQFNAGSFAYVAGQLHDIGKATEAFQQKLHGKVISVDHKTEGGRQAIAQYGSMWGKLFAYIICGHHGGLPDDISCDGAAGLQEMLGRTSVSLLTNVPELPDPDAVVPQNMTSSQCKTHQLFYFTMLIRMIFSTLVDADYLDTEAFMEPQNAAMRVSFPPLQRYNELFEPKLNELLNYPQDKPVNVARRNVLQACLTAAERERGFFKLTVPTGGGKTLSSLAFALRHAEKHGMNRIVYAIPFTSITEQNAKVFRDVFGDDLVLEHHSNVGEDNTEHSDSEDNEKHWHRLACENWDAPLIVTTNVQLFESLFAAKPSKARKIHNLANSIIILDEAQTLPDRLLLPTIAALKSLVADFGATVVFCTATQPSIKPEWLDDMEVHEIIADTEELFSALSRTNITNHGILSDDALAEQLIEHEQVLCIVNTRAHARNIFRKLEKEDGVFHLSAVMCPEHRSLVLSEIKSRLQAGERCIVVSTQLIEAGVDIDFPCVYRAVAGIDSIAQAAGRCNREGKLVDACGNPVFGQVFVFTPEAGLPKGWFQRMAMLGEEVMEDYPNPLLPDAIEQFFNLRYGLGANLDEKEILTHIENDARNFSFQFREIERNYKLIDSNTIGVIIPYDEKCREILHEAESATFPNKYLRKLQRYSVSIYGYEFDELKKRGCIYEPVPGMFVLNEANFTDFYDEHLGLVVNENWNELII